MAGEPSRTATWRSYLLGASGTTRPDAAATCDPTGAFDGPVALVGFTMGLDQHAPRLSSDTGRYQLYVATRHPR